MDSTSSQLQGQNGGNTFTDTALHTAEAGKPWAAVQCMQDTVFTALDSVESLPADLGDLTGLTIPAGVTIFGRITTVHLASGAVIAYF